MTNETADKRSVATDALETLGTIIPENSGRDAIHLAVEPVVAAVRLEPGQDVGLAKNGNASDLCRPHLGIVDPFLKAPVEPGDRFWLVVYPRQITSLRHVWTHPAFDGPVEPDPTMTSKAISEKWLRDYAASIDERFDDLMHGADKWVERGEYYYGQPLGEPGDQYFPNLEGVRLHPDFWGHYEAFTGKAPKEKDRHSFFTCSC